MKLPSFSDLDMTLRDAMKKAGKRGAVIEKDHKPQYAILPLNDRGAPEVAQKKGKRSGKSKPAAKRKSLLGCMKGTIEIHGDIVAPIDEVWDAMK